MSRRNRRPYPSLPTTPRALLLVLLALLAGSCGDASDEGARTGVRRLAAASPLRGGSLPPERRLAEWSGDTEQGAFDTWDLGGAEAHLTTFQDRRFLAVSRERPVRIRIPVELRTTQIGRVRMEVASRQLMTSVQVSLKRGDETLATRRSRNIRRALTVQEVLIDFPEARWEDAPVDALELEFSAGADPFAFASLSVLDAHVATFFPADAIGGFGLVRIQEEARRATCLLESRPHETELVVRSGSEVLRFSYGLPEYLPARSAARLVLELRSESGRERTREFLPGSASSEAASWHQASVPLREFVGEAVHASFRFEYPGEQEAACALGRPQVAARQDEPDTVLLITSDTHRGDHLGLLWEGDGLRTDTLDRLARGGVTFTDAFSSTNNTTPSHVSLFTGLPTRDTGIIANFHTLAGVAVTLAERYAERGYLTYAAVSATPVNYVTSGLGQGFDRYSLPYDRPQRNSSESLETAISWVQEAEGVPLFLWLHVFDAHSPYEPPKAYERLYYPADRDPYDADAPWADLSKAPRWDKRIADPLYTDALYRAEITSFDEGLASLLDLGRIWDGTTVFTGDHGENLSTAAAYYYDHRGLSVNTLSVPLILRAPGLEAGSRIERPVMIQDLGRTLLNLTGHADAPFPGEDLLALPQVEQPARYALGANACFASVQLGRWMLTMRLVLLEQELARKDDLFHSVALYDVDADPYCKVDVREQHSEEARKLRALLVRWLREAELLPWESSDGLPREDFLEQLANLGYTQVERADEDQWIEADCDCPWCLRFEEDR